MYGVNTAALAKQQQLTNIWLGCIVNHLNEAGEYYVCPRPGHPVFIPFYASRKYVRKRNTHER
jgi:hypothetical protein